MAEIDDVHQATIALQEAIQRLAVVMRIHNMPGDPAAIEADCTRIAQGLTDATRLPLAEALRMTARQVDTQRVKIERRHQ